MTDSAPRPIAVLGPTNTGKTHVAVERMLAFSSGMIGLPLRLLAREIYDRVVAARGAEAVALITGEEKITPFSARYYVCTVEAMPLDRKVEFVGIDEIQLCADPERGHVFTQRLLHARGRAETMFMGATTAAGLIRRLCPEVELRTRERLSTLTYDGSRKLVRLPKRSAIVAFSSEAVYGIAELIRRQRGGAAVVMGSLSPRTRNAQVALFQSGEVDFLVATDAIGMGLNMDVDHVAFAGLRKFDGRRTRDLYAQEIAQIAGRAGRNRRDGTFGVTGDCGDIDSEVIEAVETHIFPPLEHAEWRNAELDFRSLQSLLTSLTEPPRRPGLRLTEEGQDERTLRRVGLDETVQRRARDGANLRRLWDVCQIPDFPKATQDEHDRLVLSMFLHLTQVDRRIPEDWMGKHFGPLDRLEGDIDVLQARLSRVRTLAYVANRGDWLADSEGWRRKARHLEDRLSDTLHEALMHRFVDRRTSVILRSLGQSGGELICGVGEDGTVTVEGHRVGAMRGLDFERERGASALEERALRGAVERLVSPEMARRLGALAAADDEAFGYDADGRLFWKGGHVGDVVAGGPFSPRIALIGEFGSEPARVRAARRLETFLTAVAVRKLGALHELERAVEEGRLRGLARGLAYQLVENCGVLDRLRSEIDPALLSRRERRELKALGVRFTAFNLHLQALLDPDARPLTEIYARLATPNWRPSDVAATPLPARPPAPAALGLRGLQKLGGFAVPVICLERLDAAIRASGGFAFSFGPALSAALGVRDDETARILKALGFVVARKGEGVPDQWRRRSTAPEIGAEATAVPAPRPRRARRRRRRDTSPPVVEREAKS